MRRNSLEALKSLENQVFDESLHRKRSRRWEREHQSHKAVYRGVDPKLAWKVKVIAGRQSMQVGEVARVIIEYALRSYERGDLDLFPHPDADHRRMTLSPGKPAKRVGNNWRVVTTWRGFLPQLKQEVATLASNDGLNVPVGELVSALLCFGLQAYDCGLLKLDPVPKDAEEEPPV